MTVAGAEPLWAVLRWRQLVLLQGRALGPVSSQHSEGTGNSREDGSHVLTSHWAGESEQASSLANVRDEDKQTPRQGGRPDLMLLFCPRCHVSPPQHMAPRGFAVQARECLTRE